MTFYEQLQELLHQYAHLDSDEGKCVKKLIGLLMMHEAQKDKSEPFIEPNTPDDGRF